MLSRQLRLRFLASLAASGALVGASLAACGGAVDTTGDGTSSGGTSGSSGTSSGSSGSVPTRPPPTTSATPTGPDAASLCAHGKDVTSCYTRAELEAQLRSPNRGGDQADAGDPDADVSANFDPNGCLPAAMVHDGCCNAAVVGPTWNGATCCYVHCTGACCGRPFLVAGEARVAAITDRNDWLPRASPRTSDRAFADDDGARSLALSAEHRQRIATAWARDAAMEHASVASFARFTLELLALGAPADLVLGAQEAGRDEIEHARACFAIASRHADRALGPGKLDVGGVSPAVDLEDVVAAAIAEGCVGETLSSLLAEARLARAEDAHVRSALRRIANEEARHAELSWRFVGWAIATGGEDVRSAVARGFALALSRVPQAFDPSLRGIPRETLRAHGLLDEVAAYEVTTRAMQDVVAPCVASLVRADRTAA